MAIEGFTLNCLYCLAAPLAVVLLAKLARGSRLLADSLAVDHPLLHLVSGRLRGSQTGENLPAYLALIVLSLVFTQPALIVEEEVEIEGEAVTGFTVRARPAVVIVLDVSGSMSGQKIVAAKKAVEAFTVKASGLVDIGLVAFSHTIVASIPPTSNVSEILRVLERLVAGGGTMYSYGLSTAISHLTPYVALDLPTAIVFVTDGEPGDPHLYPQVVEEAKNLGNEIHTVFVGTPSPQAQKVLQSIAQATGGRFYTVENVEELIELFEKLGSGIAANLTARAQFEATTTIEYRLGLEPYLALTSLLLLLLAGLARLKHLKVTV